MTLLIIDGVGENFLDFHDFSHPPTLPAKEILAHPTASQLLLGLEKSDVQVIIRGDKVEAAIRDFEFTNQCAFFHLLLCELMRLRRGRKHLWFLRVARGGVVKWFFSCCCQCRHGCFPTFLARFCERRPGGVVQLGFQFASARLLPDRLAGHLTRSMGRIALLQFGSSCWGQSGFFRITLIICFFVLEILMKRNSLRYLFSISGARVLLWP